MIKSLRQAIRAILLETYLSHDYEPIPGDVVKNTNPGCKHFGSLGVVLSVDRLPEDAGIVAKYMVLNSSDNFKRGQILVKTLDQLEKA